MSSDDSRNNEIVKVADNKLIYRMENTDKAQIHIELTFKKHGGLTTPHKNTHS